MGSITVTSCSAQEALVDGGDFIADVETLWQCLEKQCEVRSDAEALVVKRQPSSFLASLKSPQSILRCEGSDSRWTFADMEYGSRLLAQSFHNQGMKRGDVCLLFLDTSVEWGLMYWTATRAGFAVAPLDSRMVERPQELADHLAKLKPKALVVVDDEAASRVDMVGTNAMIKLVSNGTSRTTSWSSLEDFGVASKRSDLCLPSIGLDAVLHIMFTSGTTLGQPKGCAIPQRTLLFSAYNFRDGFHMSHRTRCLLVNVVFRVLCPTLAVAIWAAGGTVVMDRQRYNPEISINNLISERCSLIIGVPTHVFTMSESAALPKPFPVGLECVAVGADIVDNDMARRVKATFGSQVNFITGYGMTEGMGAFGWKWKSMYSELPHTEGGVLSLGMVMPGAKAKIVDAVTGEVAARGVKGDLHISSAAWITSYMDDINPQDFYVDEYGPWFKTGDVGLIDDQGYVFIVGRSKDIIKYVGGSLSPAVLESVLNKQENVLVKVVGLPSDAYGAIPVAVVKCTPGQKHNVKKMLVEASIKELGIDYGLHRVYLLQDLGLQDFPVNDTGKVQRRDLVELIKCAEKVGD